MYNYSKNYQLFDMPRVEFLLRISDVAIIEACLVLKMIVSAYLIKLFIVDNYNILKET